MFFLSLRHPLFFHSSPSTESLEQATTEQNHVTFQLQILKARLSVKLIIVTFRE